MTKVSALPFMLGITAGVLLFAAWLPMAVRESRRPYRWPEARPRPVRREALARWLVARPSNVEPHVATPHLEPPVVAAPPQLEPHVVAPRFVPQFAPRRGHAALPRVAIVVVAFTVWSLWSLRNRVDHR
jgi:hypothetical protein